MFLLFLCVCLVTNAARIRQQQYRCVQSSVVQVVWYIQHYYCYSDIHTLCICLLASPKTLAE